MKFIITENKLYETAIKWLNKNYGNLKPYETGEYPNHVFYMKNGEFIFDYNKKNGQVFISYSHIWSFLENFFSMETQQIHEVTKLWVEEHYKLDVTTTNDLGYDFPVMVEEHYKLNKI
jgi:hypothetical protein